jgi:uncharacterized membrane protein YraQ (UPF0718 family)
MREFAAFVILDGLLLFGLFYAVTFLLALAQQHSTVQGLMQRLRNARLGTGSLYAAGWGAITPFCSCSTIPIFSAMVRARIRFGIAMTFLLSSPLVDEATVIVMATYFGLPFTALFILLTGVFSMGAGIALDLLGFGRFVKERVDEEVPGEVTGGDEWRATIPLRARAKFAEVLARNEVRAVAPYIVIGLLVGGAIHGFIPETWIAKLTERISPVLLIPIMAVLGAPLYFNTAAAVPVAFALTEKHLPVGAVMAFLVAGSATSAPEMILLVKMFRPRLMVAYVVAAVSIAIAIGYIFNAISWNVQPAPRARLDAPRPATVQMSNATPRIITMRVLTAS